MKKYTVFLAPTLLVGLDVLVYKMVRGTVVMVVDVLPGNFILYPMFKYNLPQLLRVEGLETCRIEC